jgi:hypothetical protein
MKQLANACGCILVFDGLHLVSWQETSCLDWFGRKQVAWTDFLVILKGTSMFLRGLSRAELVPYSTSCSFSTLLRTMCLSTSNFSICFMSPKNGLWNLRLWANCCCNAYLCKWLNRCYHFEFLYLFHGLCAYPLRISLFMCLSTSNFSICFMVVVVMNRCYCCCNAYLCIDCKIWSCSVLKIIFLFAIQI